MKTYYAFVEDFKKFMRFFRHFYPELYGKYSNCILMPVRGMTRARISNNKIVSPVARFALTHIITEFYVVRCN